MKQEAVEFWMVWTKNGRPPRHMHGSAALAETEAQRLASKYPGRRFIVLQAYTKYSTDKAAEPVAEQVPA